MSYPEMFTDMGWMEAAVTFNNVVTWGARSLSSAAALRVATAVPAASSARM